MHVKYYLNTDCLPSSFKRFSIATYKITLSLNVLAAIFHLCYMPRNWSETVASQTRMLRLTAITADVPAVIIHCILPGVPDKAA